jgi:hypothetical protein
MHLNMIHSTYKNIIVPSPLYKIKTVSTVYHTTYIGTDQQNFNFFYLQELFYGRKDQ